MGKKARSRNALLLHSTPSTCNNISITTNEPPRANTPRGTSLKKGSRFFRIGVFFIFLSNFTLFYTNLGHIAPIVVLVYKNKFTI